MERGETPPVAGPPLGSYAADGWVLTGWVLHAPIFAAAGAILFYLCSLCPGPLFFLLVFMYLGLGGLMLTVIAFVLTLKTLSSIGLRVEVRTDGLVWHRFGTTFIPWGRVRTTSTNLQPNDDAQWASRGPLGRMLFWNGPDYMSSTSIQLDDGRWFTLTSSVPRLAELTRIIEEETSRRLVPAVLKDYLAGKSIDFGHLQISLSGVRNWMGRTKPWDEVTGVAFTPSGYVIVRCQDKEWPNWVSASPAKVSNRLLLLRLLAEIKRVTDASWPLLTEDPAQAPEARPTAA
jgi:hypothetical protein